MEEIVAKKKSRSVSKNYTNRNQKKERPYSGSWVARETCWAELALHLSIMHSKGSLVLSHHVVGDHYVCSFTSRILVAAIVLKTAATKAEKCNHCGCYGEHGLIKKQPSWLLWWTGAKNQHLHWTSVFTNLEPFFYRLLISCAVLFVFRDIIGFEILLPWSFAHKINLCSMLFPPEIHIMFSGQTRHFVASDPLLTGHCSSFGLCSCIRSVSTYTSQLIGGHSFLYMYSSSSSFTHG